MSVRVRVCARANPVPRVIRLSETLKVAVWCARCAGGRHDNTLWQWLMTDVCTLEAVQAVGTAMLEKSHLVEGLGAVGLAHHIPNLGDSGNVEQTYA